MKCLNCKNLGWGEEYPGKKFFGWCEEVCDAPELDRERECEHFVRATNSDIIRRMSDEELAEFLILSPEMEFEVCRFCEYGNTSGDDRELCLTKDGICRAEANCEAFKKWLRQPAKEDT